MKNSKRSESILNVEQPIEPLVDEYEYAHITKRSVASARRDRVLKRGCPYVKWYGQVRYRLSDIREFIAVHVCGGSR